MKTLITTLVIFSLGLSQILTQETSLILDSRKLDANNISVWFRNNGTMHRNPTIGNEGFEWPKGENKFAIYVSCLWLAAKINDSIRVAVGDFGPTEYASGQVNFATQQAEGLNDPFYRIYKVSPLYPNGGVDFDSWSAWPINQGAHWIDNNNNGIYEPPIDKPVMKGDQNIFCAFTDGFPQLHNNYAGSTPPLNADIHLYAWAKQNTQCADVIYQEWEIINKKNVIWDSLLVGFFSNISLGNFNDDVSGCDSNLNLAFGYNKGDTDAVYGNSPPAVGYLVYDVTSSFVQRLYGFQVFNGSCCLEPHNYLETFRQMKGLQKTGAPWINPITNQPTRYKFTGNPETYTGWLDPNWSDERLLLSSYVGNVYPLDTVNYKMAIFIKRGVNNLNSVTALKNCANQIIGIEPVQNEIPKKIFLYQNYPNPFNPMTKIKFDIKTPQPPFRKGGTNVTLIVYDVLGREVATLVNEQLKPGTYEVEWDGSNFASGVYYYQLIVSSEQLTEVYKETKRMLLIK